MKRDYTLNLQETENGSSADKLVIRPYQHEDTGNHSHNFFELAYITGGSCTHTLNDVSCTVTVGDYFIIDFGSIHSYTNCKELTLINCLFLPEIIDDTLKDCCSFEALLHSCLLRYYKIYLGKTSVDRIFHDEEGRVLQLLTGLMKEYQEKQVGYLEIYRCRLQEILILMMRNVLDRTMNYQDNAMISEAMTYLNHHYQSQKVLEDFCKQFHFTPQYISRRFKQETGVTIREYQQKIRMEKCCELLAGSDILISEVAQVAGYRDMKAFHKLFKRMLKMSPREYRRMSSRVEYGSKS